jgi:NAD(P)-dependent dehydrogenase (short-subunit alcohol dehydrogenase family)
MAGAAIVTGAARGIGQAVAVRLAAGGHPVVASDLGDLDETVSRISDAGGTVVPCVGDVTRPETATALVDEALRAGGAIDAIVPCAGIGGPVGFLDIAPEEWDGVFAVNVDSVVLLLQAALPHMMQRRAGSIVLLSSVAARRYSNVNGVHYTASKYALVGMTRHIAAEIGSAGVRINCVCPGTTLTPRLDEVHTEESKERVRSRTPLGRLAEPDDVAAVVAFLASDDARHVHGAVVDVNGGAA